MEYNDNKAAFRIRGTNDIVYKFIDYELAV
jgi:hypothetical protein